MQIIDLKKFAVIPSDLFKKAFIMDITYIDKKMSIHLVWKTQIILLPIKKVSIPTKYFDHIDVFSKKLAAEPIKRSDINKPLIDLKLGKQLAYWSIYSLEPMKLNIFKTFIEVSLANSFICLSKSFAQASIFLIQKLDSNFCLYINYQSSNNLTIEN